MYWKKGYLISLGFIRQSSAWISRILLESPHVWHKRLISRLKREYFQPIQSKLLAVIASTDMLDKNMNQHSKNSQKNEKGIQAQSRYNLYQKKILVPCMSGFFVCGFWGCLFLCLGILRKLPEDGRGSKLRKGHRDNMISYELKVHINLEGNNGKAFNHYKSRDKNPEGQKTNKRGMNQEKYSITNWVIQ